MQARAQQTTGLLLVRAAKLHRATVGRHLARAGLHVGQDLLLLELEGSTGMAQRELADRLGVEQATVGVALRRLEAAGFVERTSAPDDGRVRLVLLTPRGREALPQIHAAWQEGEKVLTDPLTAAQLRHLHAFLNSIGSARNPAPADSP
jgi:DNA-binding MarR family transcriptional regulator